MFYKFENAQQLHAEKLHGMVYPPVWLLPSHHHFSPQTVVTFKMWAIPIFAGPEIANLPRPKHPTARYRDAVWRRFKNISCSRRWFTEWSQRRTSRLACDRDVEYFVRGNRLAGLSQGPDSRLALDKKTDNSIVRVGRTCAGCVY